MRFGLFLAAACAVVGWTSFTEGAGMFQLKRAQALPFLVERGGQLKQVVRVEGAYTGDPAELRVTWDGKEVDKPSVKQGEVALDVLVGRVTEKGKVALALTDAAGAVLAEETVAVRPVREVTVYIVPHSHVDIGYTQPQPAIEQKQVNNLLTALKLIHETRDNAPGERFRWTSEAGWTLEHFLKTQPAERVKELEEAVRAGDVELDAAYTNVLTGLCRDEELARVYKDGVRSGERFGRPVDLAMISDVPGYVWGTMVAMSEAGVRYFSIGPNLLDRIGTTLTAWEDKPFYWETPDGKHRVLCWVSYKGYAWSHFMKTVHEGAVLEFARHLESMDWPYDVAYVRWSGVGDNAVPAANVVDSVKEWNAKYAWPRLRIGTAREAFVKLEEKYAKQVPTVRGDWTPYWEDGAGSSALETAMNRASSDRLTQAEALWAMLHGGEAYPADQFDAAWRYVMLYSEHTWGAWCSIQEPEGQQTVEQWKYKRGYALEADRRSKELMAAATGERTATTKVDVYNTESWERGGLVTVSKQMSSAGDRVLDEKGQPVPSQRLGTGELVFRAERVPAFGARRYEMTAGKALAPAADVHVEGLALVSGGVRVRVDEHTGDIVELVGAGGGNVVGAGRAINEYNYVEAAEFDRPRKAGEASIHVGESGPLVASLVIESATAPGCRALVREVRLTAEADWVDVVNRVDKLRAKVGTFPHDGAKSQDPKNGKESVFFAFPFEVPGGKVRVDGPFAVYKVDDEQMAGACKNWLPAQRFVDVSNEAGGVTLAVVDAPMITLGGNTATLIGSQTDPKVWRTRVGETQEVWSWVMNNYWHTNYRAWQEGETVFRYAIRPHGKVDAAGQQRFGMERSRELLAVPATGEVAGPRLKVGDPRVLVTGLKAADDGRGVVVRLYNPSGQEIETGVEIEGAKSLWLSGTGEGRGAQMKGAVAVPARGVVTVRSD